MTDTLQTADRWIREALASGGHGKAVEWSDAEGAKLSSGGLSDAQFAQTLSLASRFAPRVDLAPSPEARAAAGALVHGWNPERWTGLEAVRVRLILARAMADDGGLPAAIEEAFRYADEGELCALYRSLQFLPGPERFAWRSGEGCRTNMMSVFEANGCDTAFPAASLDDIAWRQLCVKALFIGAPLWRVSGFDGRVDTELGRMALDLVDERRAAGRSISPELWLCLSGAPSERALAALNAELAGDDELSSRGAALALGRLGAQDRLKELEGSTRGALLETVQLALEGHHDQAAFGAVSIPEGATPITPTATAD
ncbi:MAG: EboA domain-containing protein [Planctomycetota bacterium]|nr:EboA domain-containing protein [Planctomycetota bacterium]MDG1985803.1 EboA domain-containing protein [Planctomycetota bacterium]